MTAFDKRCVTYLTVDQRQKLDLLILDSEEKEAAYIREVIIEHLNKNEKLIKSLQNERANKEAKDIRP